LSAEDGIIFDIRTSHTICDYLDRYFQEHDHVIVYIPSDMTGVISQVKTVWSLVCATEPLTPSARELDTARYSFQYDAEKLFVVSLFFKSVQRGLAEQIIYGDPEEMAHRGK